MATDAEPPKRWFYRFVRLWVVAIAVGPLVGGFGLVLAGLVLLPRGDASLLDDFGRLVLLSYQLGLIPAGVSGAVAALIIIHQPRPALLVGGSAVVAALTAMFWDYSAFGADPAVTSPALLLSCALAGSLICTVVYVIRPRT